MFKWACLGVAVLAISALLWMVDDIRRQVRSSSDVVLLSGATINQDLPAIVDRTKNVAEQVSRSLPKLVDRAEAVSDVLADLAEDIRQLKQLAGVGKARDENLVSYANSILTAIEKSGGYVGVHNVVRKGLKNERAATEWVPGARKEAVVMTLLVSTKKDMAQKIAKTKLGFDWWIEVPGQKPMRLLDWLKANHKETRELPW